MWPVILILIFCALLVWGILEWGRRKAPFDDYEDFTPCVAQQVSDQMICGRCHASWDVNDPLPPRCMR